jgi:hypothetical protein
MKDLQSKGLDPLALQVKYWARAPEYHFSKDWVTDIYAKIKFNVTSEVKILQPDYLKPTRKVSNKTSITYSLRNQS